MIKLAELYQELKQNLGSDESEREAQIIIESILGYSTTDLTSKADELVPKTELQRIRKICEQRKTEKIPLAYLLEEAAFMDMKLFVNSDVLIPRPETELLVEELLKEIKKRKLHYPTILDLCTGSGCIAIAIKRALPGATVYASDISRSALNIATNNAKKYETDIHFVLGDYLDPFIKENYSSEIALPIMKSKPPFFDIIVSNPPYVSEEDYQNLEAELHHEPKHALVGFPYAHIKKQAEPLICPGGFIAAEFGLGQEDELSQIFPQAKFYQDLAGIKRFFIANIKSKLDPFDPNNFDPPIQT